MRLLFSVAAVLAVIGLVTGTARAAEEFKPLFNGKDFTGFKFVLADKDADPVKTWTVKDEMIICTGKPNGYFYTDKSFTNYVLRFEVRYARPSGLTDDAKFEGNSGCLIHIQGEHKVWPKCVEVQGMNREMGRIFAIGGAPKGEFTFDADAHKKCIKPVGEWNTVEITCMDGRVTCKINGVEVCSGSSELKSGPIGWQSEGAEIHFRRIMIRETK
jgi:hypothetical protein